jgi:hypothetical protein
MASGSITGYFKYLQAPLKNSRWSWGAVREADQALFLRVWGDEFVARGKARFYRITAYDVFRHKPSDHGWIERQKHLNLLQGSARNAPTYMVICTARDAKAEPRTIADYDKTSVFLAGDIIQEHGDWWLEARNRMQAADVRHPGIGTG